MKNTRAALAGLNAILVSATALPLSSQAQENATRNSLEEVIVTARRVSESVQDVPLTVNVFSASQLENQAAVNFAQISSLVPNMVWDDGGGGSVNANLRMTLRGISSQASQSGFEPGIAIYVDDVYIANPIAFNRSLLGVERVEILKGPQGTLFGRNATAGAVALYTRRPELDDSFVELDATRGNYALNQGRLFMNAALSDASALNVSAIYRKRDGYAYNIVTNERDVNEEDYAGGRAQFLWQPTSALSLLFSAEYFEDRGTSEQFACYGYTGGPGPAICDTFHPDFNSTFDRRVADNNTRTHREMWGATVRADWAGADNWDLTSISAYRSLDASNDIDQDFTQRDALRSGWSVPEDWQISQEIRLSSDQSKRLRGVMGVYYFYEERNSIVPISVTQAQGVVYLTVLGNPAAAATLDHDIESLTISDATTQSYAIFGQGQYDLTPQLTFELGLRMTWDNKEFAFNQVADPLALFPTGTMSIIRGLLPDGNLSGTDRDEWSQLTGSASLIWSPSDDAILYARFARGYKSGGYQSSQYFVRDNNSPLTPFDQEILDQIELGVKWEGWDGRLRINVAGFQSDYNDIQVQITDPLTNARYVDNAAKVEAQGGEIELRVLLFEGFEIGANFGMQDSEFSEVDPTGPVVLRGKAIYYSPDKTASLSATWRTPAFADWDLLASASANYRDDMFITQTNTSLSESVTLINARLGFEKSSGWGVHLWGANLTDEIRLTDIAGGKLGSTVGSNRFNAPRTYGIELSGRF